jgi:hypothetical protein
MVAQLGGILRVAHEQIFDVLAGYFLELGVLVFDLGCAKRSR